jgi:excisionase family DNA binding protein
MSRFGGVRQGPRLNEDRTIPRARETTLDTLATQRVIMNTMTQQKTRETGRWMRIREVSTILGLARGTVYKLIKTGDLPSARVGKAIRVSEEALQDWMKAREGV